MAGNALLAKQERAPNPTAASALGVSRPSSAPKPATTARSPFRECPDQQDSQKGPIEVVGFVVHPLENVIKANWLVGWV